MRVSISKDDFSSIDEFNNNYLLQKGDILYKKEQYIDAIEYYRLSASMGNYQAVSNIGQCYMYGRGVEVNNLLALAYFKIAANEGVIDAMYKLGEIYNIGKIVEKNDRVAIDYYLGALEAINEQKADPVEYPSLFLALAKEYLFGQYKEKNKDRAIKYLLIAKKGFGKAINDGKSYFKSSYEYTNKLIEMNANK